MNAEPATIGSEELDRPIEARHALSPALAVTSLALITLAVFWPVLRADFVVWDDQFTIWYNPLFNPPTIHTLIRYWTSPARDLYTPVTYTVWFAIALLTSQSATATAPYRLMPAAFHAANLSIHLLDVLLVWQVLRELIRACANKGQRKLHVEFAACAGAALFAVHPFQVEPVAWVSGLKDLLGGCFSLIAILQYRRFADPAYRANNRSVHYALTIFATILAVLSKPSAVVLPAILFVLDWLIWRRAIRQIVLNLVPIFICCVPMIVITQQIQHPPGIPWLQRPLLVCYTLTFYATKLVAPFHMAPDYDRPPRTALLSSWMWASWIVPLLCAIALGYLYRKRASSLAGTFAGALIALIALSPVIGVVPFGTQDQSTVSDHYLYVPMFGLAIVVAFTIARVRRTTIAAIASSAVVILLCVRSFHQVEFWHDTGTLFTHNLKEVSWSWRSEVNLGGYYYTLRDFEKAEYYIRRTEKAHPDYNRMVALADSEFLQHRPDEAIATARQAIALDPAPPLAHLFIARVYLKNLEPRQALPEVQFVLQRDANNPEAKALLKRIESDLEPSSR